MWKIKRILRSDALIKDSKYPFKVRFQSNRLFGNERNIPESSGIKPFSEETYAHISGKITFYPVGLHPFRHIATPFGVHGYTLLGKWCSPFFSRTPPIFRSVSAAGNGSFPSWKLAFPLMGTLVSPAGNACFPPCKRL